MYNEIVLDHFRNPRNQGKIANPSAIGESGNPKCGDMMKLYLNFKQTQDQPSDQDVVVEIKFETLGCGAAIAVTSIFTEMIKDKTIAEAAKVTNQDIVKELGGLPTQKIHCSMLAREAFEDAVRKYLP